MGPERPRGAGSVRLRDFPRLVEIRRDAGRRRRLLEAPDLTYLFWEATLRCNLRCAHCGSSCEKTTPYAELSTSEVKGILDTIAEDFDPCRIFVSITGGEPLLRPDLFEVVAHMTRLGMRSCLVTNGTLLDDEAAARLVEAGMRTVSVSLDGTRCEHEAVRGAGTYERALTALTRARAAGFRVVEAITCVRPANLSRLDAIEREVRGAGAGLWRLLTLDRMGRLAAGPATDMWLEPAELRVLLDFIEARRAEIERCGEAFDLRFSCGGFLGPTLEHAVRPGDGQCFAGLCVASILCDGQVSACPSLPRSMAQGSARERRFSEIWKSEFRQHRELAWRKTGPCADCSWFGVCLGGGLHERLAQPQEYCWLDRLDGVTGSPP